LFHDKTQRKHQQVRNAAEQSRGGNNPDVVKSAIDAQRFGADGVTVHPRPDERHIRYDDVREIKKIITTEFNIEGNPTEQKFVDLVLETKPHQVTLVPDALGQLTSDHGWDTIKHKDYLIDIISVFKKAGIRVSIFVDPDLTMVTGAAATGTDRIELYTEGYANHFTTNQAMQPLRLMLPQQQKQKNWAWASMPAMTSICRI
jgi:pyridoxine 5-phosphate synthase